MTISKEKKNRSWFHRKKDGQENIAEAKSTVPAQNIQNKARLFVMIGLALSMLLSSLDQTVVGTSLPKIVSDLGGMTMFSWLFAGYMLASTITIPIAGKLSDNFGRRPIFLAGMGLFLGGSILAGMSTSMEMLVAFRFVQGLGGGTLMPIALATVADLYAPTERGKIQGMFGALFAVASTIGPFIGGFIVDNLNWHWVFYVNLPVGIAAIAVAATKFPHFKAEESKPIDYLGISSLTAALTPLLLIVTWGGTTYAWLSPEIIGMSILSAAAFSAFVIIERRAADPVLPLHLFKNQIFSFGNIAGFLVSFGLFGVIAFLPMFLQAIIGMSATNSGETLIPLMMGVMATSVVSGFMLKKTGYKVWLILGPPLAAIGLYMLSTLSYGSPIVDALMYLVVIGAGLGCVMSNYLVAAQNVFGKKEMGVVSSSMSLFRSIGGTIGVSVLGAIVNNQMVSQLTKNLPTGAMAALPTTDVNSIGALLLSPLASSIPPAILGAIRLSYSNSLTYTFLLGGGVVIVALVFGLLIKSVPLKSTQEYHEMEMTSKDKAIQEPAGTLVQ